MTPTPDTMIDTLFLHMTRAGKTPQLHLLGECFA
jgi:hypothetical protein